MRFRLAPVVICLTVVMASFARTAQAQPPLLSDTWLLSGAIGLAVDADGSGSFAIAGAAAYPITDDLAVEGELAHVFDISPGNVDVDASLTSVHASALYFINTEYVLTPYVAAGIGLGKYAIDLRTPPRDFSSTEFGFNLGGGVTYPLSGTTYFRGDFRYFKHIDDVPSVWRFTAGVSVRVGGS